MSLVLFSSLIFGLMKADELLNDTMNNSSYDDALDLDAEGMDINETDLTYIDFPDGYYPQDLDANTDGIDIYSVSGGNTRKLLDEFGEIGTNHGRRPTPKPTRKPKPTKRPTRKTRKPTKRPTRTRKPTPRPTRTRKPTQRPTPRRTPRPTPRRTPRPTPKRTKRPTPKPTKRPTPRPTRTKRPTPRPTRRPTKKTRKPTKRPTKRPTPRPTRRITTKRPTPNRFGNKCIGQDIDRGFEFLTQSKSLVLERGIIECRKWEIRRERGFKCGNFDCYSIKLIPDNLYLGKDIIDGVLSVKLRRSELWVIGAAGSIVDDLWALKHVQTNQFLCGRGDIGIGIEGQVFFSPNGDHSGCHWRFK